MNERFRKTDLQKYNILQYGLRNVGKKNVLYF